MIEAERLMRIKKLLAQEYPRPKTELKYNSPFQLLIATILSAQTTDKQVNKITSSLFSDYPTPASFLSLSQEELQQKIRSLGLYREKSRHILELCRVLVTNYAEEIPNSRKELMALPGVGRKTANVVLANAFNIPAFAVDTHVGRVARRLGLTQKSCPLAIERDLCNQFKPEEWNEFHHRLIFHGRTYCRARHPRCNDCFLYDLCPSKSS